MPTEQNSAATAMVDRFLEAERYYYYSSFYCFLGGKKTLINVLFFHSSQDGPAKYREPEIWEKNLVSLNKGEWGDDMQESAFHRYKKTRRNLGGFKKNLTSDIELKKTMWARLTFFSFQEIFNPRQSIEDQNNSIQKALDNHEVFIFHFFRFSHFFFLSHYFFPYFCLILGGSNERFCAVLEKS